MDFSSYVTIDEGNTYFHNRLNSQAWEVANPQDQQKALIQATKLIDRLNYAGRKADPNQILEFPRGNDVEQINPGTGIPYILNGEFQTIPSIDTVVPDDIKVACFEIAIQLLDDVDMEQERRGLQADSFGYSSVKATYDRKSSPEWIMAGIPSAAAWDFLKPYLLDPRTVVFSRST